MSYLELAWAFFKIGLFSIGGGYSMIPMLETELVSMGAITETEIYNLIAIAQMTPGAFALNSATFCGMRVGQSMGDLGILGAVIATSALVLPSAIITSVVAIFFYKIKEKQVFKKIFSCLKPVAIALIMASVIKMIFSEVLGIASFDSAVQMVENARAIEFNLLVFFITLGIAVATVVAIMKFKVHPVFTIIASGVLGILIFGFI